MRYLSTIHFFLFACVVVLVAGCNEDGVPVQKEVAKKVEKIQPIPMVFKMSVEAEPEVESSSEDLSSSEETSSSSERRVPRRTTPRQARLSSSSEAISSEAASSSEAPQFCKSVPRGTMCDLRDGQIYRTVVIGSQVWMAQNLNFNAEGSWCYNNREDLCKTYGRLYQWTSALDLGSEFLNTDASQSVKPKHQGVCPEGWRVPNSRDMKQLADHVTRHNQKNSKKENVGTSLKAATGWKKSEESADGTNLFGFNALPTGSRKADGIFTEIMEDAGFWVTDETGDGIRARYWDLYYANDDFWGSYSNLKTVGYALRCIKN